MVLVELHVGGDCGGGGGNHGACAPMSCIGLVARPVTTHGGDASHAQLQDAPPAVPQHREPELVL